MSKPITCTDGTVHLFDDGDDTPRCAAEVERTPDIGSQDNTCPTCLRVDVEYQLRVSRSSKVKLIEGVLLLVIGECNGERFAETFRSAWDDLPPRIRNRILSYWKRSEERKPTVILCDESLQHMHDDGGHRGDVIAHTVCKGLMLRFLGPVFDQIPTQLGESVIAHELAHVGQWASGIKVNNIVSPNDPHEVQAREWVCAWGFSTVEEVEAWEREHVAGYTKGLPDWRRGRGT